MGWESKGSWLQAPFQMLWSNLLLYNLAEPLTPYVKVGLMTLYRLVVRIKRDTAFDSVHPSTIFGRMTKCRRCCHQSKSKQYKPTESRYYAIYISCKQSHSSPFSSVLDPILGKLKEPSPQNHSVLLAKGIIQHDTRQG